MEFKSLIDGGIIAQWSFVPASRSKADLKPAESEYKGKLYKINRAPTDKEYEDLLFGWLVESGITSNSVIYVKDLGYGRHRDRRAGSGRCRPDCQGQGLP